MCTSARTLWYNGVSATEECDMSKRKELRVSEHEWRATRHFAPKRTVAKIKSPWWAFWRK